MNAIDLLTTRSSCAKLVAPLPSAEEYDVIFRSALRAPDHAGLRPWRFLVYDTPHSLQTLGELFVEAEKQENGQLAVEREAKLRRLPLRAPGIIVALTEYQDHPKVPHIEQAISCGCAVQGMLMSLQALGYAGYWRTGGLAQNKALKRLLGASERAEIVGFLYYGTPVVSVVKPARAEVKDHFTFIDS